MWNLGLLEERGATRAPAIGPKRTELSPRAGGALPRLEQEEGQLQDRQLLGKKSGLIISSLCEKMLVEFRDK